jgi:hypothetical protein
MTTQNNNGAQQIQIKITDEIAKGNYANMMMVTHTTEEFVLDFVNLLPPNGMVTNRVIVSPGHMKRMLAALQENMDKYENSHGKIKAADAPDRIGFNTEA